MHAERVLAASQSQDPPAPIARRVEVIEVELNRLIRTELSARALVEEWGTSGPNRRARLWMDLTSVLNGSEVDHA